MNNHDSDPAICTPERLRFVAAEVAATRLLEGGGAGVPPRPRAARPLRTGYASLDRAGLKQTPVTLLTGADGVDTTDFAATVAFWTARILGRVLWFGDADELVAILLSQLSKLPVRSLLAGGTIPRKHLDSLADAREALGRVPLHVARRAGASVEAMRSAISCAQECGRVELVVVEGSAWHAAAALRDFEDALGALGAWGLVIGAHPRGQRGGPSAVEDEPRALWPGTVRLHLRRDEQANSPRDSADVERLMLAVSCLGSYAAFEIPLVRFTGTHIAAEFVGGARRQPIIRHPNPTKEANQDGQG